MTTVDSTTYIAFHAIDNGAGINMNRIHVISGGDTLASTFEDNTIWFKRPLFFDRCFIKVSVQDNAKNSSPDVFWKLEQSGTNISISGPYSDDGGF